MLVVAFAAAWWSEWRFLRVPLANYLSSELGRPVHIGALRIRLGSVIVVRASDVRVADADWTGRDEMVNVPHVEAGVRLWPLFGRSLEVVRLAITGGEVTVERRSAEQTNWRLEGRDRAPRPGGPRAVVQGISLHDALVHYIDQPSDLKVEVRGNTLADNEEASENGRYGMRMALSGSYRSGAFSGEARTGALLSLMNSEAPFPVSLRVAGDDTQVQATGTVADVARMDSIDAQILLEGPTLADLYPFLLLPLPESPPYSLSGHLTRVGSRFALDDLEGRIGKTDVSGSAAYEQREPRPLLTADLHSKTLDMADLGPMVGLGGGGDSDEDTARKTSAGTTQTSTRPARASGSAASGSTASTAAPAAPATQNPDPTAIPPGDPQAAANPASAGNTGAAARTADAGGGNSASGAAASRADASPNNDRILPSRALALDRLNAMDADVRYQADSIHMEHPFAFQSITTHLRLHEGVLRLDPLKAGFAGGTLTGTLELDGHASPVRAKVVAEVRQARLAQLFPTVELARRSAGTLGANMSLAGQGDTLGAILGSADGTFSMVSAGGALSHLLVELMGLDAGQALGLLLGQDRETQLRCAVTVFDVKKGVAHSELMVLDTVDTRVDGSGTLDLARERLDFRFNPQPKDPSILVARSPVLIGGTFADPKLSIDKGALLARLGSAVLLGLVNPLAALIPLIETGPGSDADCGALVAEGEAARREAGKGKP